MSMKAKACAISWADNFRVTVMSSHQKCTSLFTIWHFMTPEPVWIRVCPHWWRIGLSLRLIWAVRLLQAPWCFSVQLGLCKHPDACLCSSTIESSLMLSYAALVSKARCCRRVYRQAHKQWSRMRLKWRERKPYQRQSVLSLSRFSLRMGLWRILISEFLLFRVISKMIQWQENRGYPCKNNSTFEAQNFVSHLALVPV